MLLVCGYKRTGKDTLFDILNNKNTTDKWLVYSKDHSNFCFPNIKKHTIALEIKRYAHDYLGIEDKNYDDIKDSVAVSNIPKVKDRKLHFITQEEIDSYLPKNPNSVLRDWYIAFGSCYIQNRSKYYWCEQVKFEGDNQVGISDFRYAFEYFYFSQKYDVLTVRLYRSNVPEPAANIITEHDLDNFETDYLLVPDQDDFNLAVEKFPQYQDYQLIGELN